MINIKCKKDWCMHLFRMTDHEREIEKIQGDKVEITIGTPEDHKSQAQNRTFYMLLDLYWNSGLSSFNDSFDMKYHYKKICGLIKEEEQQIDPELREFLLEVYKKMPNVRIKPKLVQLVKNKKIIELSWSNVTKDNARLAINSLVNDMVQSGVNGKRFDSVMNRMDSLW